MALSFTVGGARGTFEDHFAEEVAEVLDHAFGAEGEWEGSPPLHYGELADTGWSDLQKRGDRRAGGRHDSQPRRPRRRTAAASTCRHSFRPSRFPSPRADRSSAPACSACATSWPSSPSCWELPLDDDGLQALLESPTTPTTDGSPTRPKS